MADNTTYTPGTGVTIAADEVGGVLHQRVKVSIGGDGVAADCADGNPLPAKLINAEGTPASAIPAKVVQIGGSDGTNARAIKTNSAGELQVGVLSVTTAAPTPVFTRPGRPTSAGLTNAAVDVTGSGDKTLVAAVASQTTRVFRLFVVPAGDTNVIFKRGSTALTGTIPLKANQGFVLDYDGEPWWVTGTNEAFVVNLSAAVDLDGFIQYETSV